MTSTESAVGPAPKAVRPASARGGGRHGWLDTRHSFSFGDYYDPDHMGFRNLRVLNEDRVLPSRGFGRHGHRDMEIVSVVLAGALEHQDSLGHRAVLRPGEVQRITAGTGIEHSEKNPSADAPVHFLQIWIEPQRTGLPPSYEQKQLPPVAGGGLTLAASPDGRDGGLTIHADALVYRGWLPAGGQLRHAAGTGRYQWLQIARGALSANGTALRTGDGASWEPGAALALHAQEESEFLLFDLP